MNKKIILNIILCFLMHMSSNGQFYEVVDIKSQTVDSKKNECKIIFNIQEVKNIRVKKIKKSLQFKDHIEIQLSKPLIFKSMPFLNIDDICIRSLSYDHKQHILYIKVPKDLDIDKIEGLLKKKLEIVGKAKGADAALK